MTDHYLSISYVDFFQRFLSDIPKFENLIVQNDLSPEIRLALDDDIFLKRVIFQSDAGSDASGNTRLFFGTSKADESPSSVVDGTSNLVDLGETLEDSDVVSAGHRLICVCVCFKNYFPYLIVIGVCVLRSQIWHLK